jgi:hypothetical protein
MPLKAQITLTVNEAKRIIAKGLARHRVVQRALHQGRIFLKGGTTVSAVAEELTGHSMRISGRISPKGAKTGQVYTGGYHCAVIEKGELVDAEGTLQTVVSNLKADDVGIMGANAIDVYGNAAIMYGAPIGGGPGIIISGLLAEIPHVFIAAGLEKLVPGSLTTIVPRVARKGVRWSMGMAVGLTPISGQIISEDKAIEMLAKVDCTVIGRGGVFGAEGATTLLIEGEHEEVQTMFEMVRAIKGADISGRAESLAECSFPHDKCKNHAACIYKQNHE